MESLIAKAPAPAPMDSQDETSMLRAFGYTTETLEMLIRPMAKDAMEGLGNTLSASPLVSVLFCEPLARLSLSSPSSSSSPRAACLSCQETPSLRCVGSGCSRFDLCVSLSPQKGRGGAGMARQDMPCMCMCLVASFVIGFCVLMHNCDRGILHSRTNSLRA
jgi:hypothetical protein